MKALYRKMTACRIAVGTLLIMLASPVTAQPALAASSRITTIAGNGHAGYNQAPYCHGDGVQGTTTCLSTPKDVAVDPNTSDVYISDTSNNRVRKLSQGTITTIAGNGTKGYGPADSPACHGDNVMATSTCLNAPRGLSVDENSNVYIADTGNNRIRKVTPSGVITTVAGNGTAGYGPADSPNCHADNVKAITTCLNRPWDVVSNMNGSVFIADTNNQRVRKVDKHGTITTLAGNGNFGYNGAGCPANPEGVPAASACLTLPESVALDTPLANVYIADSGNQRIREVVQGVITTVAGNGHSGYNQAPSCPTNPEGVSATNACLNFPNGVVVDKNTNFVYVSDSQNNRARKFKTHGTISTVAGNGSAGYDQAPNCPHNPEGAAPTTACLNIPQGVALGGAGNLMIVDSANNRLRLVTHP